MCCAANEERPAATGRQDSDEQSNDRLSKAKAQVPKQDADIGELIEARAARREVERRRMYAPASAGPTAAAFCSAHTAKARGAR